MRDPN